MSEPGYVRQTAENVPRLQWWRDATNDARTAGFTFFRYSWTLDVKGDGTVLLIEGWTERPDDPGEPRFAMVPGKPRFAMVSE